MLLRRKNVILMSLGCWKDTFHPQENKNAVLDTTLKILENGQSGGKDVFEAQESELRKYTTFLESELGFNEFSNDTSTVGLL